MASSIQDRMAYLRDLLKKRRKKTDEPTQVQSASTQSNQTSSPQKQTTVGNQRGNEAILQTRKKQEQAQQKASDSSMQKNQTTKQASIADMLWFNGANILKTDDENYVEDKPAKKSTTPMIRKPNIEYMRDPVSGKAKDAETMPLSDLMLMFRQLPAAERAEASELFEQDYLRRKSSPYYDPYYTTKSNNKTAVELWGTDDLTSVVTDPENLKYLDYVRVSKNGQSPLAPTKKSSVNERKGYSLFYLLQDYEDEQSAKNEMPALYREIGELAQAYPDASEQEILDMVDWSMTDDDGNKAFKTISDYREAAANRMEKYTVGGGLYVGDESLKAVVRAARRGEDVSEIKDYLSEDVDNRLWQMMGDENAKRRPKTVDSASSMSGESQADGDTGKSIINQIGDKYLESEFKSNADRIGAGLGSLVSKALQSTAVGIRSFYNTYGLGARRNADPMEQSVSTTGKIDLRDPNIPETQWEYLIQAGLASADQRDAILAQRQGEQDAPEYTGMASGTFNAQSSAAESSGMSMQELSAYKETLTAQLAALQQNEQSNAQNLPGVEQEIFKLENDLANGADPEATNAALSELYAKRDAMAGSADNQAGRSAAMLRIQSELADVNEGIAALRESALKRSKAAQQAQQKPAETTEQRTARLMSADIDEMSADVSMLETAGRDARDRYSELTARIGEIEALVGGLNKERAEQDPSLMAAYSELQQMREERSAIEIANPDLDLTSDSDLNTRIMRKKQEVLDAAKMQYGALQDTSEDFAFYAAKGMALPNSSPGAGSVIADNISNPATYAQDYQAEIAAVIYLGTGNKGDATLSKLYNMGFMTDVEVQTYSYLLGNKEKYGPEKAELYYQSILDELEYRQGERIAGAVSENTAASIAYGGLSGIGSAVQGLTQVAKPNEIVPYNAAQYAGGIIREGLAGKGSDVLGSSIAQWGFDTAQTLGNMLPVMAVNSVAPGSGPVMIGVSAGGNAYNQSLREGHTQEEATRFAVLSGLSEAGLESVLGMTATGGGKLVSMVGKKTASAMSGAATDVLKGLAATMISNGTEEYLQDVLVPVFDTLAYGEEFKGLDLTDPEALRSGIMGALIAVIGDSPEIASRVLGAKALGSDFNSPDQIAAMLEAGAMAPEGSKAQTDSEAAAVRMEEGQALDNYRVGKLVESVGPDLIAMVEAGRDSTAAPETDAEQAGSPSMEDVQTSADEMQTDTPDSSAIELSDDAIRAVDAAARQVAYAVSRDQKSFTPSMLRTQQQLDVLETQMNDAVRKQITARQTSDDLKRRNGEILLSIANGETKIESALKQVQQNAQEAARSATESEQQRARYSAMSSQYQQMFTQLSKAQGELYQATYQVELNKQLNVARQRAVQILEEAKSAQQAEADRQASAARVAEIDAQMQEIDARDAQLGTSEEFAKRAAQQALDAENAVLNSIGTDQAAAEQAEQASATARKAYDQLQAVQKQREQNRSNRERLGKERAELMNKYALNPAPVKPQSQPVQQPQQVPQPSMQAEPAPAETVVQQPVSEAAPAQEAQALFTGKETRLQRIKKILDVETPAAYVPVEDIQADPDSYQFKGDVDKAGVTKPLTGTYRPGLSGEVIIHRRLDGSLFIADGHHRLDLAKRSGVKALKAVILDEADGITIADARAVAAARNIASGRGTVLDAAKVFRETGVQVDQLEDVGLSKNEALVDNGMAIASLAEDFYRKVVSGEIDEFFGALIGKTFPGDEAKQRALIKIVGNRRSKLAQGALVELANLVRISTQREGSSDGQIGLFDDTEYFSNAVEIAQLVNAVKNRLKDTKNLFKKLSSEAREKVIESVGGNVIDAEANLSESQRAAIAEDYVKGYYYGGPLQDIIVSLATDIADKKTTLAKAAQTVYDWVVTNPATDVQGGQYATNRNGTQADSQDAGRAGAEGQGITAQPVKRKTSPRKLAEANGSMPLREGALVGEYVPKSGNTSRVRRVSETARDLYRSLGVPYTAKNKPKLLSRKAVAVYESHPGVVVTRTFQNVAGYAHEIGHALFDRAKVFDAHGEATDSFRADIDRMVQNLPKAFRDNYDASDLPQEAAAEFVRAYLTDWNAAVNFAGEAFVRRFENEILSRTEVKALRTARERFNATLAAELADVYRARIDYSGKQDVARGAEGAWGRFIQGFADKYYSVLLFDIAANKAGYRNSDPNKRAYIAFSNIPYSVTQAANIVETNLSAPDGRVIGLSMKDVTRPITRANMNDFDTYLLALHDIDRQEQGKPVFGDYTAETSEQVARQMEALHPEFKQVHGDLMTWWDTFIDEWVVKNNAIENAAEKVARFRELYPNYVPTFRSKNDQVDVMTEEFGDMGGLLGQASVHFQKAKGGDQAIKSPIASMVARVGEIVTAANKVEAMRRVHEAYQATPGMGEWLRKVPADKATGNGKDETLRIIDADGAVHHYQVMDKLFYDALLGGASKSDGKLWDAIGRLTGVFKQLTTMSNPFFAISNAMRDYTEAYTKGSNPEPVTFALQWVKAIAELTAGQFGKDTKTLDAYYAAGGGDSSISPRGMLGVQNMERTMYSKYFPDALRRMVAGRGLKERARGGADVLHVASSKLKGVINAFNNVIEGSQRYAEFSRTMRRTGDARTAMYASTNVTTDFRRAGNWDGIHKAGRVFAFMNAGIQGTYSWYRLAKESRFDRKAFYSKATRAAVMFAMVPIAAKMLIDSMGDDDKEAYAAMAENVKADNILIPKSLVGGKAGEFYKIPKPKGPIPAVGDALGRALIEAMEKEGSWDAFSAYGMEDWAESSVESLIDSMNPYGSPIFAPVLQVMMNQTWYGSPIESKWMRDDDIAPANRIKDTTSSAAIWLANLPGLKNKVSPIQVDYVLNQTLGVAGDYITGDVGNALIDGVAGKQNGYRSGSSTAEFVRTRLNTDPTAASDITSSMYDADSLLQGIVADSEQDGPNQDPYARLNPGLTESEQKTAVREAKNMTKKGGVLYKAKKLTSAHYDEIDKIEADAKLTDEERTEKTRAIKWQMILENKVAVDAAEDYIRKYIKGTPAMYAKVYGK
jgi:hypothetical protein